MTTLPAYRTTNRIAFTLIAAYALMVISIILFLYPLITTQRWVTVSSFVLFFISFAVISYGRHLTNLRLIPWAQKNYGVTFTKDDIWNFRNGRVVKRGSEYWIMEFNNNREVVLRHAAIVTEPGYRS